MKQKHYLSVLCLSLRMFFIPSAFADSLPANPTDDAASPADYFPAVTQELARLQIVARCTEPSAACTFDHRSTPDAPPVEVQVRYSRITDTVYIYIDPFLTFAPDKSPSPEQLLRLLSLNAEMVTSKLEWQAASHTVRLSTVLSCDSNFDRRAFRSQLKGLLKVADTLGTDPTLNTESSKTQPVQQ